MLYKFNYLQFTKTYETLNVKVFGDFSFPTFQNYIMLQYGVFIQAGKKITRTDKIREFEWDVYDW